MLISDRRPVRNSPDSRATRPTRRYFRHPSSLDAMDLRVSSVYTLGFISARILASAVGIAIIRSEKLKSGRYSRHLTAPPIQSSLPYTSSFEGGLYAGFLRRGISILRTHSLTFSYSPIVNSSFFEPHPDKLAPIRMNAADSKAALANFTPAMPWPRFINAPTICHRSAAHRKGAFSCRSGRCLDSFGICHSPSRKRTLLVQHARRIFG